MQDIHSIGGGGGRLFGGGGDRRLRPHHQNHQALKCPRCDSLNTKFCYYNNYNLSQPRHFCKNCRRYWTKGGVLRNVPVGGGCRKSKRSKPKSSTSATADGTKEGKSNSHSSSESSSLTATTVGAATSSNVTAAAATAEVASASASNSGSKLLSFQDGGFFIPASANPSFDQPLIHHPTDGQIFPEMGSFTSLMTSTSDPAMMGFNVDISTYRMQQGHPQGQLAENQSSNQQWQHEESKMAVPTADEQEMAAGFLNQTAQIDFHRTSSGGLSALDWQATGGGAEGDQGLFDLTGTVDPAYWSQTQWGENDHTLNYLP